MSKVKKLDAYTMVAHQKWSLPEGWRAHSAKASFAIGLGKGALVKGAAFKPYKYSTDALPAWSRRLPGTAQSVFISDAELETALAELRAEAKAKNAARFPFMFIVANDEADAADFLTGTIFPDFYAPDRMISAKAAWGLIQKWGGAKVRTARTDRIIALALETWNNRAGENEAAERARQREAMA